MNKSRDRQPTRGCSWTCFDAWCSRSISTGYTIQAAGPFWGLAGIYLDPTAASRAFLFQARYFELAERLEDAARIYDQTGLWKEAGELRRRAKAQVVRQVHVDVNALIQQVRQGGLSVSYTCPSCSSPVQISPNTTVASLRTCAHCGAAIQTTDLAEFLSKVLR